MENRLAKNRTSPKKEDEFIAAYKQLNKSAMKLNDGLDVAAVTTKDGTKGYALMLEKFNRSKDRELHRTKDFIPLSDVKKQMNK